ncbi:hypothetical protein SAMN02799636_04318 [Methylobacterium sp. 275MFSha3.1]|uniref:hypothetical protein n=1 Tax=Methylobacterium sp. 275MFSha3.1 TaxID=1502746 RepID=UPI0008A7ADC1|nr:hypothetical protein [Methylobacterium sp. 275MFSha3.1]SEH89238.1 hypothetical protein SAMN02799636_04318 [Methylobacterium sp. 275MFSha3.1]
MHNFTRESLRPNRIYVELPYGFYNIVQMTPRWLDGQTLQLALSMDDTRGNRAPAGVMTRHAGLKQTCPGLADALAWCKDRRMGVKMVTVPLDVPPEDLVAEAKARFDGNRCVGNLYEYLTRTSYKTWSYRVDDREIKPIIREVPCDPAYIYSHRLMFTKPNGAFEFKMRWC